MLMSPPGSASRPGWMPTRRGRRPQRAVGGGSATESARPVLYTAGPGRMQTRRSEDRARAAGGRSVPAEGFLLGLRFTAAAHSLPLGPGRQQRGRVGGDQSSWGDSCHALCAGGGQGGRKEGQTHEQTWGLQAAPRGSAGQTGPHRCPLARSRSRARGAGAAHGKE